VAALPTFLCSTANSEETMEEALRKRLDEIAGVAQAALKVAEQAKANQEAHEEICLLIRKGHEEAQKRNEQFQSTILNKVEDGLKLVRESFQISQTDQAAEHDRQMSDFNVRLGNSIKTTIDSITTSVNSMKDTLTLSIGAVSNAMVVFSTAQTQTNKDLNEGVRAVDNRMWTLVVGIGASVILTLLGALGATVTKLIHLW